MIPSYFRFWELLTFVYDLKFIYLFFNFNLVCLIQATSSLFLPHTACLRSPKGTPRTAKSYIMGAWQGQRIVSSLTVSTPSRSVYSELEERNAFCSLKLCKWFQIWMYFVGQWSCGGGWRGGQHTDTFQICRGLHFSATGGPHWALWSQT